MQWLNSYGESWDSSCVKLWVPVQNHWFPVQKTTSPKLKMLGPLKYVIRQIIWTDSKTLYYRLLKLKMQSFYIFKAQKRLKQICIFKQQPQKSHGMDILPKNLQIDRSLFASSGMHAMNYFAFLGIFMHQGHRTQR